jgi:hypothetical protein
MLISNLLLKKSREHSINIPIFINKYPILVRDFYVYDSHKKGVNMNKKIIIISVLLTMVLAACAPAQPAVEVEEPAVMEEQPKVAAEDTASEEASADEAAEQEAEPAMAESAAEVSFSADVWPIIEEYALDAHGGNGGVFLENYDDIVAQVVPGDPENSRLYKVLIADGAPQMPPGNPLPDELIQTIYDWIVQGAQNN